MVPTDKAIPLPMFYVHSSGMSVGADILSCASRHQPVLLPLTKYTCLYSYTAVNLAPHMLLQLSCRCFENTGAAVTVQLLLLLHS